MAQLTEYIPGVTSGRGPSSGAPDPGLTAGAQVFGVIGDLVGLRQQRQQELDRQEDRAWNREQRDRARTEWGKQDRQEAAQDEIASAVFQVQRQEVENNRPGLPPITFNPPPSVVSAIQGLDKIRKAERQGRLPPGSTDIKLENVVSDVFTRYPDQTAEILDWMGARQYDHYLWREQKLAEAASANEAAVRTKTMDDVNKKGAELGWYDPFKTREENYSVIQPRIAEMTRTEEQRKLADAAMKQTEFTQGQTKESRQQTILQGLGAVYMEESAWAGTAYNAFVGLRQGIGDDPKRIQEFGATSERAYAVMHQRRNAAKQKVTEYAIAAGVDPAPYVKQIDELYDGYQDQLTDFTSGPLSDYKRTQAAADYVQNRMSLKAQEAWPIINLYSKAFGQSFVQQAFAPGGMLDALPKEDQDRMKAEYSGGLPKDPYVEDIGLFRAYQILKGDAQLSPDPRTAMKQIRVQARALKPLKNDIDGGAVSVTNLQTYVRANTLVTNAAITVQPGIASFQEVETVTQTLFDRQSVRADISAAKNPVTQQDATALIFGKRGLAVQMLEAAKAKAPAKPKQSTYNGGLVAGASRNRPWQLVYYDSRQRRYIVANDRKAYDEWAKGSTTVAAGEGATTIKNGETLPWDQAQRLDPEMATFRDTLNRPLEYLLYTKDYDDDIPKGVSDADLAAYYGNGMSKPLKAGEGQPGAQPQKNWEEQLQQTNQVLDREQQFMVNDPDKEPGRAKLSANEAKVGLAQRGVSSDGAAIIAGASVVESGGDLSIPGDGGKSVGFLQWDKTRRNRAEANGFNLNNQDSTMDFIVWELQKHYPKVWEALNDPSVSFERKAFIFNRDYLRPKGSIVNGKATSNPSDIIHWEKRLGNAYQYR